jgi:hypothetical protein
MVTLSSFLLVGQMASAEHAISIYGGVAFGEEEYIQVTDLTTSPFSTSERYLEYSDSPELGLRYTYWWTYIGLAFDMSAFFPNSTEEPEFISYEVLPLSLMLMLRWPLLKNEEAPRGKLQPYLGFGPSFVVYNFKLNYTSATTHGEINGEGNDLTWDLRAGLNWQMSRHHSFFFEFRYTNIDISAGDENDVWGISRQVKIQTELKSQHILIGYSFSF